MSCVLLSFYYKLVYFQYVVLATLIHELILKL
jgi:hypothetical protein